MSYTITNKITNHEVEIKHSEKYLPLMKKLTQCIDRFSVNTKDAFHLMTIVAEIAVAEAEDAYMQGKNTEEETKK